MRPARRTWCPSATRSRKPRFTSPSTKSPKRETSRPLKRLANIQQNPQIAVCVDRYGEDWTRLAWVLLRGPAEILTEGPEHDRAQSLLRGRYPQYRAMRIEALPVIALRIARVTAWGALT